MASSTQAGSLPSSDPHKPKSSLDLLEWYPQFQSCHLYFVNHAQHAALVRALAAFINIQLPYQKHPNPIGSVTPTPPPGGPTVHANAQEVSLTPYIRRLVVTGYDTPVILGVFFGPDWATGIGSMHEAERRNYLFAAKSTSWMKVKQAYDMSPDESCPFLIPLREATEKEIQLAEATWSEWLAMQDWMLGPRYPDAIKHS